MDDRVCVGLREGVERLDGETHDRVHADGPAGQAIGEVLALEKLHRHEGHAALVPPQVAHLHDPGMAERGQLPRLALESLDGLGARCDAPAQRLDRDGRPELDVPCRVDRAHAADPEQPLDPVTPCERPPDALRRAVGCPARVLDVALGAAVHEDDSSPLRPARVASLATGASRRVASRGLRRDTRNKFSQSPFEEEPRKGRRDSSVGLSATIDASQLSVVFQPIVRLETNQVFAYECLLRCTAPGYEVPTTLFDRASHLGFAGRLGRMIRDVALPLAEGVSLFLNIHPDELSSRWIVRPDDPIYTHDAAVFLEVTESVPLAHFELCRSVLREVRSRRDVHLVVDDLGAGFSNLKHIVDLEPDVVKLDMQLIRGIHRAPRLEKLVRSIVRMCEDLGASVVAEGIEEQSELDTLIGAGVQFGQGYLLARPSYPMPLREKLERGPGVSPRTDRARGR